MPNPYYSCDQTAASRAVLDEVIAAVPGAILIGGWGTWARTGGPMSHDIDLIITRPELAAIGALAGDLSQSRHLAGTKWRGTWRGIHLDLYVPYQSRLGANLQLRAEKLAGCAETVGRYRLLTVPAHLATKIAALLDRPDSQPGRKDRQEILALLDDPAVARTPAVLRDASARTPAQLATLTGKAFAFLAEAGQLTRPDRARLRRLAVAWTTAVAGPGSPCPPHDPGGGPRL